MNECTSHLKPDLILGEWYSMDDNPTKKAYMTSEMMELCGEKVRISKIEGGYYHIQDFNGQICWTDEMFEFPYISDDKDDTFDIDVLSSLLDN